MAAPRSTMLELTRLFLRLGLTAPGGPAAHIAMLEDEVVERRRWPSQAQLLDASAIGQFTPGPVLSTATFIGHIIAGTPGAVIATLGIFLP